MFQSTYLYKVRPVTTVNTAIVDEFQSTYLYKVRHDEEQRVCFNWSFNPRTYIRYD